MLFANRIRRNTRRNRNKSLVKHGRRSHRPTFLLEGLEMRTLLTATALTESVSGTPVINEAITPQNTDLLMNQFNAATAPGASVSNPANFLGAHVDYATDAHINIQSEILNPAGQPPVTGSYSGNVTTTLSVPGTGSFPGPALTSTVNQPNVNFTVQPGAETGTDGSNGRYVVSVNLTDPKTGGLDLSVAQANAAGYVGTGSVQDPSNGFPHATGTGVASFTESGGGNETATTTKFAHTTATLSAIYYYTVPGAISGRKFLDTNPASTSDNASDPAIQGWVIHLDGTTMEVDKPGGGVLQAGGAAVHLMMATLANGTYSFAGLAPGTYTVSEEATNASFPGFHQTFGGTYNVTIGANGVATVGSNTGNDFGNAATASATISIAPAAVNAVGQPHTFTVTVLADDGIPANLGGDNHTGPLPAANANVTYVLTGSNGAVPNASTSLTGTTDANGHFSVTFTSAKPGLVTGTASAMVSVGGQTLTVQTDGQSGDSGAAIKRFVDAYITITPASATNPVGAPHTETVTVFENDGLAANQGGDNQDGYVPLANAAVSVTLSNSGGALATPAGPFNGTTNSSGQFQITFTSQTAGTVTAHAATDVNFARLPSEQPPSTPLVVHRETNGQQTVSGSGVSNSGDAVKTFIGAPAGATATMGFWQNRNGQAVIQSDANIGNNLAALYPNLFGAGAAPYSTLNSGSVHFVNLAGQSSANVAAAFTVYFNVTGPHSYAQLMSNVLAAYFDAHATSTSTKFGFGGNLLNTTITLSASQQATLGLPATTTVGA